MNIRPECVPCLMGRVLFQAKLVNNGTEFESVRAGLSAFSREFAPGRNSAEVATEVHRNAYKAMGVSDPYRELKERADKVAAGYVGRAEEFISSSENRIKAAALLAVIGNIMDFGAGLAIDYPEEFEGQFGRMVAQGIGSDDTDGMIAAVKKSRSVIYLFDNCGESLFDTLLIREIQALGVRVVGVVRGEPILNDVTMDDAKRTGLDKVPDLILTTGQFAIGIDLKKIGDELRDEMSKADLIIAKGMANYESLSYQKIDIPTVYMLRSKCVPVADSLGVAPDINVVRFVK